MNALEAKCDRLVEAMGGQVVRFSSPRKAQICDIPDRRYRLRSVALWCEVKGAKDKLTRGQLAFLLHGYCPILHVTEGYAGCVNDAL